MTRTTWFAALVATALAGSAFAQPASGTGASRAVPPDQTQTGVPPTGNGVGNDQGGTVGSDSSTGGSESSIGGSAGTHGQAQAGKRTGSDTLDKTSQGSDRMGATFAANQIVGQIRTVDRGQKQITIDQAGQPQNLQLSDNATVFVEGRLGSWQDLKEGQQVRAAYEERGGQKTLRWIEVAPQGSAGGQQGQQQPKGQQQNMPQDQQRDQGVRDQGAPSQGGFQTPGGGGVHDDAGGGSDVQGSTQGSTKGGSAQQGVQNKQASNEVIGTVVGIDPETNKLTLSGQDKQWTLNVRDQAPVFKDGQKTTFDQIREGQQVRASLDQNKQDATRLEIITAAPGKEDNTLQKADQQRQNDMRKGTTETPY